MISITAIIDGNGFSLKGKEEVEIFSTSSKIIFSFFLNPTHGPAYSQSPHIKVFLAREDTVLKPSSTLLARLKNLLWSDSSRC